jgi:hypothetical protein
VVAAALDERIWVCVDLCCLTDFQALIDTRGLDGHNPYYYVPGLLKYFSAAEINALMGHFETWDMRQRVLRFLDQFLLKP